MAAFEPWHVWMVLGIVLLIGEMFTPGFFLACLAAGAFAVAFVSFLGAGTIFQIFFFSITALACLFTIRPFFLRYTSEKTKDLRTGAQALVGRKAVVVEAFGGPESHGKVKVGGEIWRAMGNQEEFFSEGDLVMIASVSGVTLVVYSIPTNG